MLKPRESLYNRILSKRKDKRKFLSYHTGLIVMTSSDTEREKEVGLLYGMMFMQRSKRNMQRPVDWTKAPAGGRATPTWSHLVLPKRAS